MVATMTKFARKIDLLRLLQKKSYFLFGPRGTGKSFLIKECFDQKVPIINLLKSEDYFELNLNPETLRNRIDPKKDRIVVIDEIQKIPQLLNEVHLMIEEYGIHFLLTGSSMRRLKAKDTNLLGGRARKAELFPLTFAEIDRFDLQKYLRFGGLPSILNSDEPREDLSAYLQTYINEEVKMESNVRKIDFFHRFLETAALHFADITNYSSVANDVGVSDFNFYLGEKVAHANRYQALNFIFLTQELCTPF
jgi:predicted AAA+ superfamily ATPase